ncbi:hypothetical protein KX928_23270 [Roseobacter sp. YSTF-M11]|uniref:Uncharacterized protein n=1 Tax=Roseobacter insulae TaxID=2859783 RepID=A0A9X1FZU3_9RHOB|nr:hypothetical protein [Roseobacter insulae]MBW4710721.1 hypothetical protein [Roseobacter insulae]
MDNGYGSAPTTEEIRDALDNAPEMPPADGGSKPPVQPPKPTGGGRGGAPGRKKGEIFDDCPVTPLGINGDYHYFLDASGQMRKAKKLDGHVAMSLFGHAIGQLCYNFAEWKKEDSGEFVRKPGRFDAYKAGMAMYTAVGELGPFNPDNSVRDVGAWTDDDGNLIYHTGDVIYYKGEKHKPGRLAGKIYPARPPIPHPGESDTPTDPVPEIMRTLETWNWTVPDVHPFVALGMICVQMLCGALDWRPVFWLLAPAGAGKSELQKLIKLLHGDDGLIQTTDATKSGITSKIGQSSLPVAVDELEPGDERSTKEKDIIALARVAASGGEWFRGSADQSGVGGKVYSAFLFSSILIPGVMKTQDVQRLIRLELKPLDEGIAKLNLQPRTWRSRGEKLKQLLMQRWETWPERLSIWRHELEVNGVMGRDADNWSTVLAMADMAMQEAMPDEGTTSSWAKKIAFVASAGREDTMNDADAMVLHLMGQPLEPWSRGDHYTVAQWILAAANLPGAPKSLVAQLSGDSSYDDVDARERQKRANEKLARFGLRVAGTKADPLLFIANKKIQGLLDLFKGTEFAGGAWSQSASRIPGAKPAPNPLTLAGIPSRGQLVPLSSIPGLSSLPMDAATVADAPAGRKPTSDVDDFG